MRIGLELAAELGHADTDEHLRRRGDRHAAHLDQQHLPPRQVHEPAHGNHRRARAGDEARDEQRDRAALVHLPLDLEQRARPDELEHATAADESRTEVAAHPDPADIADDDARPRCDAVLGEERPVHRAGGRDRADPRRDQDEVLAQVQADAAEDEGDEDGERAVAGEPRTGLAQHAARRGVGLGEDGAGKGNEQGGTHGRSIGTARWAQTKEGRPWGRPSRSGRLLRRDHFASVGMRMP